MCTLGCLLCGVVGILLILFSFSENISWYQYIALTGNIIISKKDLDRFGF